MPFGNSKPRRIRPFRSETPPPPAGKMRLRLGTVPPRSGRGGMDTSGRRRAATGWFRRSAAARRPPRPLASPHFSRRPVGRLRGLSTRNGPIRLEVDFPGRVCCRRCGANPCGGGRCGAPDRARSLWGASEVTDLAASGPRQASQRASGPGTRIRSTATATHPERGVIPERHKA
jgi:hypothetical protein